MWVSKLHSSFFHHFDVSISPPRHDSSRVERIISERSGCRKLSFAATRGTVFLIRTAPSPKVACAMR